MNAWAKAGFARRSQSAGGHGEAERSERGGGGGWGAEGRSEPFEGSHPNRQPAALSQAADHMDPTREKEAIHAAQTG